MPNHGWGVARIYQRNTAQTAHPFDGVPDLPCRTGDPDAWFPEPSDPGGRGHAAQSICQSCPIREACLAFALSTGQWFGTWGGVSAGKRSNMPPPLRDAAIEAGMPMLRAITAAREREYHADGRRTA